MRGPALAAQRARPATIELCPSLDTAFSVSFPAVFASVVFFLFVMEHNDCMLSFWLVISFNVLS